MTTPQDTVHEPARDHPVLVDVDVVVVGGGVAGVFAALAAGGEGARTAVVDRFGFLGGNIGPGMTNAGGVAMRREELDAPWPVTTHIMGGYCGVVREFLERHDDLRRDIEGYAYESAIASHLAMAMCRERGVRMLLSTYAADPILEGDRVAGVFVEGKSGRGAVRAKVVIDATGEADLARRAGAPVLYPKAEYTEVDHHAPTGAGLCCFVANVDWDRHSACKDREKPTEEKKRQAEETFGYYADNMLHLFPCMERAMADGWDERDFKGDWFARDLPGVGRVKAGLQKPAGEPGFAMGRTGFLRPDMADTLQVAETESMARILLFEVYRFYRDYVPGFENSVFIGVSPYLGARGGPCIEGEVTLRTEDFVEGRRFDDVVFIFGHVSGGKDVSTGDGQWTDYPYRVMLPKGLDGLLAVGRSASAIPDTLIRGRNKAMANGQIGGLAAALCAREGVTPKRLDVKLLQRRLLDEGFHLGDEARLRELGL